MKSYAERAVFMPSEIELRDWVEQRMKKVVHQINGEEVRCHELARAVAKAYGFRHDRVCDGWYGMVEHSWIWTQRRNQFIGPPNILDVYAVGRLPMVQLVNSSASLPFEYRRGDPRTDINEQTVDWLVQALTQ